MSSTDQASTEKLGTIKCRGCGQVGVIVIDSHDEFGGRRRRFGFTLYGKRDDGTQVVACCKCQQTQPVTPDSL